MKYAILIIFIIILAGCSSVDETTTTMDDGTQATTTIKPSTTQRVTTMATTTIKPTTTSRKVTTTQVVTTTVASTTTLVSEELTFVDYEDPTKSAIEVNTIPSSVEIRINNDYFGFSPKTKEWPPGTYRLGASKTGYDSISKEFVLELGKKAVFNIDLGGGSSRAGYATIYVDSQPQGAQILIDSKVYGFTPTQINNLLVANKQVKIVKVGHRDFNQYVNIVDGLVINETLELS